MLVCGAVPAGGMQLYEQDCQPDADVQTASGAVAELPCQCKDAIYFHDNACP
jgi:hypothetical protein